MDTQFDYRPRVVPRFQFAAFVDAFSDEFRPLLFLDVPGNLNLGERYAS